MVKQINTTPSGRRKVMGNSVESHEKPKNAADEAAHKTVEDTKKHLKEHSGGDTHGAYNKLIESVRNTHAELDKHDKTGKSSKTYEEKVVKQLEKENLLPALALEYGQRAFEKIDHKDAKSGLANGSITNAEIKAFQQTGKTGVFGHAMLDSLVKQSDKIDTGDQYRYEKPGIDQIDLADGVNASENGAAKKKSETEKSREEKAAQVDAKVLQSFLFDNRGEKGEKSSLFTTADFDGGDSLAHKTDKIVGKHDFEVLAYNPDLTEEERVGIQKNVIAKWDDPAFQKRFLKDGYMTEETIKRATGETDKEVVQKQKEEEKAKETAEQVTARVNTSEAQHLDELLTKQVGGASILENADYLGTSDKTQRPDGKVSKEDLEVLVKSPDFDPAMGKAIQWNLINRMDDPGFKERYMTDGYLDTAKIAKEAGKVDPNAQSEKNWEGLEKLGSEQREREMLEADAKKIAGERERSLALGEKLLEKNGPEMSLLEKADFAGSNNDPRLKDGLVGKSDLAALANDPKINMQTRTFIEQTFLGDKWDSPEVKSLRDGDYITIKSLQALVPNARLI